MFSGDRNYKPYRPNEAAIAYYRPGPDRDYIVMKSFDAEGYPTVVHEYAHLIVNDDIGLAAASGAAGVHLGEGDASIDEARARLGPRAMVGVSCYDSLARARQFAAAGADYLAFGAFFPSPTKPDARVATPQLLREAKALGLPVVAIGGITHDNASLLIEAGADAVAVISALFGAPDVRAAARRLSALFDTIPASSVLSHG